MNRGERIQNNQFYHVYNRSKDRERIFDDGSDYITFLTKMNTLAVRYDVDVLAYALMPNHYHLIVRQNTGGSVSKMMGALATSVWRSPRREMLL